MGKIVKREREREMRLEHQGYTNETGLWEPRVNTGDAKLGSGRNPAGSRGVTHSFMHGDKSTET